MKRLLLFLIPVLLIVIAFRPVNTHRVTGIITDDQGNAIPHATITEKRANVGITNIVVTAD
ncbi:MAG: hypothetical protein ABR502_02370, partial [Chitinophagaceae bacterium]